MLLISAKWADCSHADFDAFYFFFGWELSLLLAKFCKQHVYGVVNSRFWILTKIWLAWINACVYVVEERMCWGVEICAMRACDRAIKENRIDLGQKRSIECINWTWKMIERNQTDGCRSLRQCIFRLSISLDRLGLPWLSSLIVIYWRATTHFAIVV